MLWERLATSVPDKRADNGPLEALRFIRARRARRAAAMPELDANVLELFKLIAVDAVDVQSLAPDIAGILQSPAMSALHRDEMPPVFQAYVRGVTRIVAAETRVARTLMAQTPPADRAAVLDETIERLLPVASHGFDLLHRLLLLESLVEAFVGPVDPHQDGQAVGIAMVDLVGSTAYLGTAAVSDVQQLIDALFEAGQSATAHRAVHIVKYVGDGLFMAGRDVVEIADAALEVIERLEAVLPLRARGGLAWGPVLERAGDVFGLPINVAHIVTKSAQPGSLLASAEAASQLPTSRRGRYRTTRLTHPTLGATRVATVKPSQPLPDNAA